MKASEKDIALFDRYFQGQLSISEQRYVDDRVKTDPEYAEAFNEYREFTQTMGLAGEIWLKNEFNKIESSLSKEDLDEYKPGNQGKDYAKKERRWNIMSLVMIIGSALLLVAFLIAIFNLPDLEEKFEQHKEKKTTISEEKETLAQDCMPILPLPFEALYGHFPELKGEINYGSDDIGSDSLGLHHDGASESADPRPIMVCKRVIPEGINVYYIDERIKDSLILINFDCEEPELYLPNDSLPGIILRCGNNLFRVYKDAFSPLIQVDDTDNTAIELDEKKSDHTDKIEILTEEEIRPLNIKDEPIESNKDQIKQAQFKGNLNEWMSANVKYPEDASKANVSGSVFVRFDIEEDGSIKNAFVVRKLHPSLDQEALRLVNLMPPWEAAQQYGKPIKSVYNLPVRFSLQ